MLGHRVFSDTLAVPLARDADGTPRSGLLADGEVVQDAIHWWGRKPHFKTPDPPDPGTIRDEPDEVIFAGYHFDHYGLFLLNTLARLWFASARPDLPLAFLNGVPRLGWQLEILCLLGVTNELRAITQPTRLRRILLPEEGFRMNAFFRPEHAAFLASVEPSARVSGRRAWLSRTKLPAKHGRVEGEDRLEQAAIGLGWEIYYPETHSITEQLAYMSSCEVIAGWSGSAFHTLILLKSIGSRLEILARNPWLPPVFRMIADARGIDQHEHALPLEAVSGERSRTQFRTEEELVLQVLRAA